MVETCPRLKRTLTNGIEQFSDSIDKTEDKAKFNPTLEFETTGTTSADAILAREILVSYLGVDSITGIESSRLTFDHFIE